jgi:DinB superfamily
VSPGAAIRRAELLAQFAGSRSRIERAARTADAAAGLPTGTWSAREVVLHLVAVETEVFQARLTDLARGDDPHWSWVEPGPYEGPGGDTLDGALALFAGCREDTLGRVAALDEAGWTRSGTHETFGVLDVGGLLQIAYDHDLEHLATLERIAG